MKIKKIKKTNRYILSGLVLAFIALIGVSVFSDWKNSNFENTKQKQSGENNQTARMKLAGKTIVINNNTEEKVQADQNKEEKAEAKITGEPIVEEEKPEAPEVENAEFVFAVIGDTDSRKDKLGYNKKISLALERAKQHQPDFVLFTGDLIAANAANLEDNKKRIENIKKVIEEHFNNYYIAFGKHDLECGEKCAEYWQEIFFDRKYEKGEEKQMFYSFDYLNTHFVLLSTDFPAKHSVNEEQLNWLEDDLSKTKKKNIIVVGHVPPITFFEKSAKECHDMSCNAQMANKLNSILKENKVDLVISGHEHAFDHKIESGIDYVLAGSIDQERRYKEAIKGSIYSIFKVSKENITLTAVTTGDKVVREIQIKQKND